MNHWQTKQSDRRHSFFSNSFKCVGQNAGSDCKVVQSRKTGDNLKMSSVSNIGCIIVKYIFNILKLGEIHPLENERV